jgi:nucleoside-diphosphate-sugar epimerase
VKNFYLDGKRSFEIRGDGKNLVDAMFVDDAVEGIESIIKSGKGNLTVDFPGGSPLTINGLVESAAKILGVSDPEIKNVGETKEYITFTASTEGFENAFRYKPKTDLESGLKSFADFLSNKVKVEKD